MKIIAGADLLKFENLEPEDLNGKESTRLIQAITEADISELLSIQRQTTNDSPLKVTVSF